MPPVFAHGRLRLYLLKLLDEAPRHGYEVIRLLEERFQGLYAPSAGTVYPRLAKLEAEGLVTHTTEGGRKVYSITDAGRAELADRSGELADLELEIRESVAELAAEIRDDVRGAAGDLRREMRAAATEARSSDRHKTGAEGSFWEYGDTGTLLDKDAWRAAKEEMRRAKQEWKEQARRAKDESRRARDEAQRARRQAKEAQERARNQAQEELQRIARQVQDQVQDHFARGDWPTGVREGLTELAKGFGEFDFGDLGLGFGKEGGGKDGRKDGRKDAGRTPASGRAGGKPVPEPDILPEDESFPGVFSPDWAHEDSTGNPARDLDRLLDRFRDDIRDAARDHGVTEDQLREARRHLSTAAAHIAVTLQGPRPERSSGS
ncbi:helix-turn-helix transcriptional regulator [Streptomyces sp. TS71-3]|uniref:helix-turn-helix transcriptional regulator n=1 Tax=Streptomyces sp. TS71-3 TaxID=2733862 RepID=UPI001B1824FD|nr:helix-turn-helix transcriptional regulator [Streptomyces sp. TS71-3]GHJ35913.1 PadR family transcriptional regulator [Streptomyces sp. TS71-3]